MIYDVCDTRKFLRGLERNKYNKQSRIPEQLVFRFIFHE